MTDYYPIRSQPLPFHSVDQKSIPNPSITLPITPPTTPPTYDWKRGTFIGMQSQYPSSPASGSHSRYNRMPSLDDSPLSLPMLLSDDEEFSPGGSTGILTPPVISVSEHSSAHVITEHAMLNAFSQELTPTINQGEFEGRGAYPLLSPQRPLLKKQMWPHIKREVSPPTTPKGHPLTRGKSYFNFKVNTTPIFKPSIAPKYTSTLSYFLRVPRRSRPALLLTFCLFIFTTMYLSQASPMAAVATPLASAPRHYLPLVPRTTLKPAELPSIKFESDEEELAALISFITSTSANVLPQLDASKPLDPGAILDFDPSHPHAREDLDLLKEEIHTLYPLILFGKMRDPWHREVKKMLAEYKIVPAPLIIELDQRSDNAVLSPVLARLLGTHELPMLTLFGKSLGSYHDVLDLREKGELKSTLEQGGISVKAAKKNKKRVKEMQREENERILGPRPIVDGQ